jgi:hypothetical protein
MKILQRAGGNGTGKNVRNSGARRRQRTSAIRFIHTGDGITAPPASPASGNLTDERVCDQHTVELLAILAQGTRVAGSMTRYTRTFFDMSLASAAAAIKLFLRKLEVAQDMVTAGAIGDVLYSVLSDADDLLNLIDEELAGVDRERHASLFATTPMLRRKMDNLRGALRIHEQFSRNTVDTRAGARVNGYCPSNPDMGVA